MRTLQKRKEAELIVNTVLTKNSKEVLASALKIYADKPEQKGGVLCG